MYWWEWEQKVEKLEAENEQLRLKLQALIAVLPLTRELLIAREDAQKLLDELK